jgi:hypothetical protein
MGDVHVRQSIVCQQVRKVTSGYIVEVPWPYAGSPLVPGEVVCKTWPEVVTLLTRAANESG